MNNHIVENVIENNTLFNISIRELYSEYLVVRDRNLGLNEWASRAGLVSRQLNLEFNVLGLLMVDNFIGHSSLMDEVLVPLNTKKYLN